MAPIWSFAIPSVPKTGGHVLAAAPGPWGAVADREGLLDGVTAYY